MKNRMSSKPLILKLFCALVVLGIVNFQPTTHTNAQSPNPFLVTPYYSTEVKTQGYSSSHPAIDYGMTYERVLASEEGTISGPFRFNDTCYRWTDYSSDPNNCGFGLYMRVNHNVGGTTYRTTYAHLSSAVGISNDQVRKGQIIGTSGHTGWSTGPHLHFALQKQSGGSWISVDPDSPSLWLDGQWANPSRPIPAPPQGQIITIDDNTNNTDGFKKGYFGSLECPPFSCPSWYRVTSGGYSNDYYWTNASSYIDYWASWEPTLTDKNQGWYEVQVYTPGNNATTWQAPYTIQHTNGTTTATIDQYDARNAPGNWVSLGTYYLALGNASVRLTDATLEGYRVHCYNAIGGPAGQNYCRVAADAMRFIRLGPSYLPDVRSSSSWDSATYIRNDGAGPTKVTITLFDTNGSVKDRFTPTNSIAPHERLYYNPTVVSWQGSAVVDASEAVSVVLLHQHITAYAYESYIGVNQPTANVHIPLLHKNNSGWDSKIFIHNTGTSSTNLTVQFKAWSGSSCSPTPYSVPANGLKIIDLDSVGCVGATFIGSAYITNNANHLLAVASTQALGNNALMETSNANGTANTVYAPLIQNNNSNWVSGTAVQNASGSTNTLSATFRRDNGSACLTDTYSNLGARYAEINPTTPGAACPSYISATYSGGSKPAAATINHNQLGTNYNSAYAAVAVPSNTVSVPLWMTNWGGWTSGMIVQNVNSQSTQVTVTFYNASGSSIHSENRNISPNGFVTFLGVPSGPFDGSAVVIADRPVAVSVDHSRSGLSDGIMSHSGIHH